MVPLMEHDNKMKEEEFIRRDDFIFVPVTSIEKIAYTLCSFLF
jgi:hypothetical protein